MTTIVERDSSSSALLLVVIVLLLLVGGGFGFAYTNGMFEGKTTVIENNKMVDVNKSVENKTVVVPAQAPQPAPDRAPDQNQPAEMQTH